MFQITRRECFSLGALAIGCACGRKVGTGFPGYALVATSGDQSISVVDLSLFRLLEQVPVPGLPTAILASHTAPGSYVLTPDTGSIHLVNRAWKCTKSQRLAPQLAAFSFLPGDRLIAAIAGPTRELLILDSETLRLSKRLPLSAEPVTLDVANDGQLALSSGHEGVVELINLTTGARSRKQMAGPIGSVMFRSDGKALLVANLKEQSVSILDVPTLKTIVDLPLAMQPQDLCLKSDGGQLFVSGRGMDGVAIVFPFLPMEVDQTVLAGRRPGFMACSADPAYLFVASANGSDVCILSVDSRKMIGIVEVGQQPSYILVTPDDRYALVLNQASGDMAVIYIASIQAKMGNAAKMRGKSGASLFTMLPVGSSPVSATILGRQA